MRFPSPVMGATAGRNLGDQTVKVFAQHATDCTEPRVPLSPDAVRKLVSLGMTVQIPSDFGKSCGWHDADFTAAGAILSSPDAIGDADVVLGILPPTPNDFQRMKAGALYIGFLDPFADPERVQAVMAARLSAIAMELVPRTTLAQKMDALSSQANLAGYVAVLQAANALGQILPMMMTPAGTLKPARVLVIGVGVAGLQAIATAKRLGARVEAFDTRPEVAEQVRSLGARFVEVDLGETGSTRDGYAKALTEAQREAQQAAMAEVVAQVDVVITTAQVFGRRAPQIITDAMIASMKPGSVIVDGAVDSGGNVEGVSAGETVQRHGVTVIGLPHLARKVPVHASQMYAANLANLLTHFWDQETQSLSLDTEDEIMDGCLIVQEGTLRNEMIRTSQEATP